MSRELEFTGYWQGEVVYTCDNCFVSQESFEFDDEDIDYKSLNAELRKRGWLTTTVNGKFVDFCCERCRNQYIKKMTK